MTNKVEYVVKMRLFQTLDGDVYERMQEYFTLFCQSELHSCGVTQELFMKILSDATKVIIIIWQILQTLLLISLVMQNTKDEGKRRVKYSVYRQ